jgi:hypothetical protein
VKLEYIDEIPERVFHKKESRSRIEKMLNEFIESNYKCAKVLIDEYEYSTPSSAQHSVIMAIRKGRYDTIECFMHKGEIYIYKKEGA